MMFTAVQMSSFFSWVFRSGRRYIEHSSAAGLVSSHAHFWGNKRLVGGFFGYNRVKIELVVVEIDLEMVGWVVVVGSDIVVERSIDVVDEAQWAVSSLELTTSLSLLNLSAAFLIFIVVL